VVDGTELVASNDYNYRPTWGGVADNAWLTY